MSSGGAMSASVSLGIATMTDHDKNDDNYNPCRHTYGVIFTHLVSPTGMVHSGHFAEYYDHCIMCGEEKS